MATSFLHPSFLFHPTSGASALRVKPGQLLQAFRAEEWESRIIEGLDSKDLAATVTNRGNHLLEPPPKPGRRIRMLQLDAVFKNA
ncbi:MAG: hypothetical protein CL914_04710 [Deltaproteobacteria bacterium]|nr:hypothetical protein [Deltaproteobacteria bacterium]